jgi:septal ring factor EnvC (AmiA/AmiB activator)
MRSLLLLAACLGLCGIAAGSRPAPNAIDGRLAAAKKTRVLVEDKLTARSSDLQTRVRALYKLTRGGLSPLWVDPEAKAELTRQRAISRRMLLRDLEEVQLLRRELERAAHDERAVGDALLHASQDQAVPLAQVPFASPVRGELRSRFGVTTAKKTGLRTSHRGVELVSRPGAPVVAPLWGRVRYVGPVRGLGTAIVLDHGGGIVAIVGRVQAPTVSRGQDVARGAELAVAAGERMYLEVRRAGVPVDPALLLGASP